jgi:hypothetical protein
LFVPRRAVRLAVNRWELRAAVKQARTVCRLRPAAVRVCWDLDNTLADSGALLRVGQRLRDAVVVAEPVPNMLEFYKAIQRGLPEAEHFILSARPRVMREVTLAWLRRHDLAPADDALCFVPSAEAKLKIWQQLAKDARLVIVDDLSYNHEHEQPSLYLELVRLAEQSAAAYVGSSSISEIALSRTAIDAIALRVVESVAD